MSKKEELSSILVRKGVLTGKQVEMARRRESRQHIPFHQAVIDLNLTSEEETYRALAEAHGFEFVELSRVSVPKTLLDRVPVKLVLHYRFAPLHSEDGLLTLAFSDPPSLNDLGNLRLLLGSRLKIVLSTPVGIHTFVKRNYGLGAETIQNLRNDQEFSSLNTEIVFNVKAMEETTAMDASISNFVNQILMEALRLDATDIHIEPYAASIRLRYRIDGLLQDIPVPGELRKLYASIISRLKVMAELNITEKRVPHDGRIAMKAGEKEYDLRVSILPTTYGEAVCLRILGRNTLYIDLAQLGMEPDQQSLMEEITRLSQGLVLLTGPTGSGKTTTLYAALAHANEEERKIVTIEDPVEYKMEGISQIQTKPEVGLNFSSGLRSVLRHDPDIIFIGEIRDTETAEIAVRSAQTGHLVFSTLHTNDSVSAITRLLEMKIEAFLIGSSLVCSIAQRLARRICRHCMTAEEGISMDIREEISLALDIKPEEVRASIGSGCDECNEKGYRGRIALYEMFLMNEEIMDFISAGVKTGELRRMARRSGWVPLRAQGWTKVQNGLISIEENLRLSRIINLPKSMKPRPHVLEP